jgi:hypothetical protein
VYPERDRNPAREVATKVQSGCADALRYRAERWGVKTQAR